MAAAAPRLLSRIAACRPRIVAFVGKDIWLHVERALLSASPTITQIPDTSAKAAVQIKSGKRRTKKPASEFLWDVQPYKLVYSATGQASYALVSTLS